MINPYDFRANQIQTNQIISSGSSGTNAKIVIYPIDKQSTANPNQGIIDSSKFNTSSIGNDVFLYVSGGSGDRNSNNPTITVFGGDVHISGTVTAVGGLSGGGSQWVEGTPSPKLRTTSSVAIGAGAIFAENVGDDVYFYVSGTFTSGSASDNIAVFGGSVRVSGALTVGSSSIRFDSNSVMFSSASHPTGSVVMVQTTANGIGITSGENNLTIKAGSVIASGSGGSIIISAGNAGRTDANGAGVFGGSIYINTGHAATATGSVIDYGDGGSLVITNGAGTPAFSSKAAGGGGGLVITTGLGGEGALPGSGQAGPGGPGGAIRITAGTGGAHRSADGVATSIISTPGAGGALFITAGGGGLAHGSSSTDFLAAGTGPGVGGNLVLSPGAGAVNKGPGYGAVGGDFIVFPGVGGYGYGGGSNQSKDGDVIFSGFTRQVASGIDIGLSGSNIKVTNFNRIFFNADTTPSASGFPGRDIGFYVSGTIGTVSGTIDKTRKIVIGGDLHVSSSATISGTILTVDGTLSNPAWAFIDEPGTGMRRKASQQLAVVAGGADTWIFSNLTFQAPNAGTIGAGFNSSLTLDGNTTTGLSGLILRNSMTNVGTTGLQRTVDIQSTVSQSSTAAFAALKVSTLQHATGSGRQLAFSVQLSSSQGDREVFSISSNGNLYASGSGFFNSGITGALNKLPDGTNAIVGTGGITTSTGSSGQITISASLLAVSNGVVALARSTTQGTGTLAARVDHMHDLGECQDTLVSGAHSTPFSLLGTMDVLSVNCDSGDPQKIALPNSSSLGISAAGHQRLWLIQKITTGSQAIQLLQDTDGGFIQGANVGTYLLTDSSSSLYPAWTLRRRSNGSWWIA